MCIICPDLQQHVNESLHICMSHAIFRHELSRTTQHKNGWFALIFRHDSEFGTHTSKKGSHLCPTGLSDHAYHINASCHICMRHAPLGKKKNRICVTRDYPSWISHRWVMSHKYESCHIWRKGICVPQDHPMMNIERMRHVSYGWVMSHKYESCHIFKKKSVSHRTIWSWISREWELASSELASFRLASFRDLGGGGRDPKKKKKLYHYSKKIKITCLIASVWMRQVLFVWVMSHVYESCSLEKRNLCPIGLCDHQWRLQQF